MKNFSTKDMVFTALFAAIFCILAPFSIPIGEVPVSVTNFLIYITIYAIGWKKATVSYIIYLLLGFVGLPVFAGFTGGISKLVSPTGGYLVGFIFTSVISGLIIEKFNYKRIPNIIGMIIGLAITYIFGTAWLAFGMGRTFMEALAVGVLPFLIFDFGKIIIVAIIGPELQKLMKKVAYSGINLLINIFSLTSKKISCLQFSVNS